MGGLSPPHPKEIALLLEKKNRGAPCPGNGTGGGQYTMCLWQTRSFIRPLE